MSIDPAHAISDTGATSVFVIKDTKVQNKRWATKTKSVGRELNHVTLVQCINPSVSLQPLPQAR